MAERWLKKIERKIRKLTSRQDAPEENGPGAEPGTGAMVESEYPPAPKSKSTDQVKNFHERVRTAFTGMAVVVAVVAACIANDSRSASWESAGNSGRSATAAESSAVAAGKSANAAEQNVAIVKKTFEATQGAAVSLGLPDGKIAEFLPGKDVQRLKFYFRNYGASTARDTFISLWPITTETDGPLVKTVLPTIPKADAFARPVGVRIPAGFPHVVYVPYRDATQKKLNSKRTHLEVLVRVAYTDDFGQHCDSFSVVYSRPPLQGFALGTQSGPDLCDDKEDTYESGTITVGKTWTPLFPFPDKNSKENKKGQKNNPQ